MNAYVDATVLIGLGGLGELDHLAAFDARPVVVPAVRDEVTTEPARTALDRAIEADVLWLGSDPPADVTARAADVLGDPASAADTHLIAALMRELDAGDPVAVVSDDRRVRTLARGLGATVTGTVGVVVRAVREGLDPAEATALIRRLDRSGLHMTASLRERAVGLIEEASENGPG